MLALLNLALDTVILKKRAREIAWENGIKLFTKFRVVKRQCLTFWLHFIWRYRSSIYRVHLQKLTILKLNVLKAKLY